MVQSTLSLGFREYRRVERSMTSTVFEQMTPRPPPVHTVIELQTWVAQGGSALAISVHRRWSKKAVETFRILVDGVQYEISSPELSPALLLSAGKHTLAPATRGRRRGIFALVSLTPGEMVVATYVGGRFDVQTGTWSTVLTPLDPLAVHGGNPL